MFSPCLLREISKDTRRNKKKTWLNQPADRVWADKKNAAGIKTLRIKAW
jgi:hypothetical protein